MQYAQEVLEEVNANLLTAARKKCVTDKTCSDKHKGPKVAISGDIKGNIYIHTG
jgi:hypothetical protein